MLRLVLIACPRRTTNSLIKIKLVLVGTLIIKFKKIVFLKPLRKRRNVALTQGRLVKNGSLDFFRDLVWDLSGTWSCMLKLYACCTNSAVNISCSSHL